MTTELTRTYTMTDLADAADRAAAAAIFEEIPRTESREHAHRTGARSGCFRRLSGRVADLRPDR